MIPLLSLLTKVTLVLCGGFVVAELLRHRSAAARHLVWMLALSGTALLTVTAPIAPALPLRILSGAAVASSGTAPLRYGVSPDAVVGLAAAEAQPGATFQVATLSQPGTGRSLFAAIRPRNLLPTLWLLGALGVAGWCVLGHIGLARLLHRATPLAHSDWQALSLRVASESGVTVPVRLFRSAAVGSPVTWGVRPVVLLPDDAESWPLERRRVVLAHEMAHAARGDYLAQLIASLVCALYWFHPLAWVASRRLRMESERACDDRVLNRGISGVEYAALLLDVATRAGALRPGGMVAIGMARPSQLEGRLLSVLTDGHPRSAPRPRARVAAWVGLAVLTVPLSALRPVASPTVDAAGPAAAGTSPSTTHSAALGVQAARDSSFERSVDASPGEVLVLDLESGGTVVIRAGDAPQVRVRGRLGGKSWPQTRVSLERTAEGVRLHSWQEARSENSSTSHRFEILVPRRFDVRIQSAGGELTIVGVEGNFDGETGGGGLIIERAKGRAELSTGGGDILVSDSDLRGRVSTGGGTVRLSGVRGGLRASSGGGLVITHEGRGEPRADLRDLSIEAKKGTLERGMAQEIRKVEQRLEELRKSRDASLEPSRSRLERDRAKEVERLEVELEAMHKALGEVSPASGEDRFREERKQVEARKESGVLRIEKAGGGVVLEAAPEGIDVSTGGGDIRIGRSGGPVTAGTGGGSVTIGPASGSVSASTGAGDVKVSLAGNDGRERMVEIRSGSGSAELLLPPGFSGRFDLESAYTQSYGRRTRIESDWELEQEETTQWDDRVGSPRKYVRARGRVGSGDGYIKVRIVNGDITIRKAR
jgi:beta-lactamase regulating signal transducer with metallopeptidase domain